jgi:hypothetical protein
MEIELSMLERRRTPETPFWTNISAENIITELMSTPRGAGIDRNRANMEQNINENEDIKESLRMDHLLEKVRCAIVTTQTNIKKRLAEPSTTFNAEL